MNITAMKTSSDRRTWSGHFCFIQCADTQFGMIDQLIKPQRTAWDKEIELTKEMITNINKMKPKPRFIIICGDMLDSFPYPQQNSDIRERQYTDFAKVFRDLDPSIKLVCVCGNHDIGDDPTPESLATYRSQFGPDYFAFWSGGVKFVVLNSQYLKCPDALPEETKRQEDFIKTIPDAKAKHIVVFQHIPYFLESPEEENSKYFNIEKTFRLKILNELKNAGVRYIFCGHYHRNAGGTYEGVQQVVTSAVGAQLGKDNCGYRIVQVFEDKITHEYVQLSKTYNFVIAGLDMD
jgi:predicted MPP superfamily phosphohydrolase